MSTEKASPLLLSIDEAATRLSLSLNTVKRLIEDRSLRSVKVRRRRLIPVEALTDFIRQLEQEQADPYA